MANDAVMEKHYIDSIRECGGNMANLARSQYAGFVLGDYSLYKLAEEEGGVDIGRKVHRNAWLRNVPWIIKDGREAFKLWRATDIPTVGRFIKMMYDRISCPLFIKEDTADRWVGIVQICPIVDFSIVLFNLDLGCPYHEALAKTLAAVNNEFVRQLDLAGHIEVVCDKFISLGDTCDRVTLKNRQ